MSPVDQEIAQQNDFDGLQPPGLHRDGLAETMRNDAAGPVSEVGKAPKHQTGPQQVLTEEETQISEPCRAKEALPQPGGKRNFEWAKHEEQEQESERGRECQGIPVHGIGAPCITWT